MFNDERIDELERRIKNLERETCILYDFNPIEGDGRISVADLMRKLMTHFDLELDFQPQRLTLQVRAQKES